MPLQPQAWIRKLKAYPTHCLPTPHLAGLCLLSMSLYFPSASSCTSLPYTKVKGAIRRSVQESGGCHLAESRTPWCDLPTPSTIPDCLRPPLTALAWRFGTGLAVHFWVSASPTPPSFHWYLLTEITDSVLIISDFLHLPLCPRRGRSSINICWINELLNKWTNLLMSLEGTIQVIVSDYEDEVYDKEVREGDALILLTGIATFETCTKL